MKTILLTKINFMKVLLFTLFVTLSIAANAQFFAPIAKKPRTQQRVNNITGAMATVTVAEPTFWMFRPAAIAGTLYVGGTVEAAAGAGIEYQNITQKGPDQRNYVNYGIGAYVLAGGSVVSADSSVADIEKFVVAASALNGTIAVGYGLSRQFDPIADKRKWRGGLFLAWKINFNN